MRLFEHADFEQAILRAAEHFRERKLRPAIIEKDYYVTEALRFLATTSRDTIIFKGGTSFAKGWNLIERFSETLTSFSIREHFSQHDGNRDVAFIPRQKSATRGLQQQFEKRTN